MKGGMDDESGESMEPMEEVPLSLAASLHASASCLWNSKKLIMEKNRENRSFCCHVSRYSTIIKAKEGSTERDDTSLLYRLHSNSDMGGAIGSQV